MTLIKKSVLVIKCISEQKWDNDDDNKEEEEDDCHGIMLIIDDEARNKETCKHVQANHMQVTLTKRTEPTLPSPLPFS